MSQKPALALGVIALSISASFASAQTAVYSSGHGDIGVGYEGGEFEPHWHLDAGAIVDGSPLASEEEYSPTEMIAQVTATRNSPNGLSSGIGVADGSLLYTMGDSYQPNLGFGFEELEPGDWSSNISLTLTGWTTPSGAEAAIYTTNIAETSVFEIAYSTFNIGSTAGSNSVPFPAGSHFHFDWGFTDLGTYSFTFEWSGTHATDGLITASETFSFVVVPEPAQAGLIFSLFGIGAIFVSRRPSRRSSV